MIKGIDIIEALDTIHEDVKRLQAEKHRLLDIQSQHEQQIVVLNNYIDDLKDKIYHLTQELAEVKGGEEG
jgi:hypothetical protein